jgi:hypothetical protein
LKKPPGRAVGGQPKSFASGPSRPTLARSRDDHNHKKGVALRWSRGSQKGFVRALGRDLVRGEGRPELGVRGSLIIIITSSCLLAKSQGRGIFRLIGSFPASTPCIRILAGRERERLATQRQCQPGTVVQLSSGSYHNARSDDFVSLAGLNASPNRLAEKLSAWDGGSRCLRLGNVHHVLLQGGRWQG